MNASELAAALGARREGLEYRASCPVHGGRSFCFREKDGKFVFLCRAGCDQEAVVAELKRLGLWPEWKETAKTWHRPVIHPSKPAETEDGVGKKAQQASRIWAEASPVTIGDPVWTYLKGRGIELPGYPEDLRTHPALDYWEQDDAGRPIRTGNFPCMLALIRNPEGRPVGIHRKWVAPDGSGKAPVQNPKKVSKVHDLTGGAVRLFPPREGLLSVSEGVEDALSVMVLWGIPCWACLGTSGLKGFEPPTGIKELIVFADRDENGAGQTAAIKLAQKLKKKMAVQIQVPDGQAKDLNQLLQEGVLHAV